MIDSHVHFWQFDPIKDAWITDDMAIIQKDFSPQDWEKVFVHVERQGCIAVQADQSVAETEYLCQLALENPSILGVVGWVDLLANDLEQQLLHYSKNKIVKGFRHIAQGEADDFLTRKEIIQGISKLHKYGFSYDILIKDHQLPAALTLVEKLPKDQKLILDHAAKPNLIDFELITWKKNIEAIAKHENVHCKISGLLTEAQLNNWKTENFMPYLKIIFDSFGPNRVLFGSDWPVVLLSGSILVWINILKQYLKRYPIPNEERFWYQNAIQFYNI